MTSPSPAHLAPGTQATILLLSCAAFFSGAALRICDSLLPRLAADFGRTPGQAGQVIISFSIAYGLMQLLFGPLGDRYGKARMVSLATAACAVGALVSALAPSFDALVALRVVWGMAAAGVIPLAMAWIGDAVPYEQRQATLARLLTGTLGGMMAGQLAGLLPPGESSETALRAVASGEETAASQACTAMIDYAEQLTRRIVERER